MKFIIKIFCLLFVTGSSAFAGIQMPEATIKEIGTGWGGESIYVRVNEPIMPAEGCLESVFRMQPGAPLFKENLSILLSAFHTQSKVRLYVDGCIGDKMHLKAVALRL